jgi:hypothetical protein
MIANQIAGLLTGGVVASLTDYESIQTYTLTGNQTSVTFSGISGSYKHLQLRFIAKTNRADTDDYVLMQLNGDTAANYSWHVIRGNGSVAIAGGATNASNIRLEYAASGNSGASNIFAASVLDILDYSDTNKYKTTRILNGVDLNGTGWIYFSSGNWRSTSAITSITLTPSFGTAFMQYSSFALYGIK